jgi:hypothetical protein
MKFLLLLVKSSYVLISVPSVYQFKFITKYGPVIITDQFRKQIISNTVRDTRLLKYMFLKKKLKRRILYIMKSPFTLNIGVNFAKF